MAFTSVVTHATGDVFPASDWNTYVRDNFAYLHGDAGAITLANQIAAANLLTNSSAFVLGTAGSPAGAGAHGSGYVSTSRAAGSVVFVATTPGADSSFRFSIDSNGTMLWGPGTAVSDVDLYRSAAGTLKTDSNLIVASALTASAARVNSVNFGGLGYTTGAGGSATCVAGGSCTINAYAGAVAGSASIAGGTQTNYTVNCSVVTANDVVVVNLTNGTNGVEYILAVSNVSAGQFIIEFFNGTAITPRFTFAVIKGSTS